MSVVLDHMVAFVFLLLVFAFCLRVQCVLNKIKFVIILLLLIIFRLTLMTQIASSRIWLLNQTQSKHSFM